MTDLFEESAATISDCGSYRYWLERKWGAASPQAFIMLNPSTADASEDDPTIRRCISFAKREGAGGLIVVNLFALRATDPKGLDGHADPVGPDNKVNIGMAMLGSAMSARPVVCAWGANRNAGAQAENIKRRAADMEVSLMCLGQTLSGAPKHPLYIKGDAPLIPYI